MIRTIEIDCCAHVLYPAFEKLYSAAFPVFEQRTEEQQVVAFSRDNYHLMAYCQGEELVGFIAYWEFDSYLYIEHLAISAGLRGKGYGTHLLDGFVREARKIVLLEIDPVIDELTAARLRFYSQVGFRENSHVHDHPPYREGYAAHPLIVLTSGRKITEQEYVAFRADLLNKVMK